MQEKYIYIYIYIFLATALLGKIMLEEFLTFFNERSEF